jgi:high-affinity iron transporter
VVWDTGWLLPEDSIFGRTLHTLIGYTDQPTQMQLAVYLVVIGVTVVLMRVIAAERPRQAVATN